ncbi:hypothetical protein MUP77_21000, partial [Candidatus Bathyarchaeota archaeon]|nr:hypothetical protein [Candidatus Bathyarchaeota archaeon]
LIDKQENGVRSMNWLRNPFGLCNWAEENTKTLLHKVKSLWYVCNHWNYGKASRVNRRLFLEVVLAYSERISSLAEGYFYFDLPEYRQFIEGKANFMETTPLFSELTHIEGSKYDEQRRLMIPMWQFEHPSFNLGKCSLAGYQNWFNELVEFARLLQDKAYRFYCSN